MAEISNALKIIFITMLTVLDKHKLNRNDTELVAFFVLVTQSKQIIFCKYTIASTSRIISPPISPMANRVENRSSTKREKDNLYNLVSSISS